MDNQRAIPPGFYTVGELAKKMNTTVRTLQYYDKEGILSAPAESSGGRRLYTDKDVIKLHQIQSMKYLGFTLDEIKNKVMTLESPEEVAETLNVQAIAIKEKIEGLTETLRVIEKLRTETIRMRTVDYEKYADIIINLRMNNEFYWMIKNFDKKTLDHIRDRFSRESGEDFVFTMKNLVKELDRLYTDGVPSDSPKAIAVACAWWKLTERFTNGDMSLLPDLVKSAEGIGGEEGEWSNMRILVNDYLSSAMEAYFNKIGYNPFKEGKDD